MIRLCLVVITSKLFIYKPQPETPSLIDPFTDALTVSTVCIEYNIRKNFEIAAMNIIKQQ